MMKITSGGLVRQLLVVGDGLRKVKAVCKTDSMKSNLAVCLRKVYGQ